MARELRIYTGLSINYGDHLHYFTRNNGNFLTRIDTYKIETLSLDNYRINANVAKCKLTSNINENNYCKVTYLGEIDTTANYYKYYHVIDASIQSGYAVFTLEVDEWGTYIARCGIGNNRIIRSTRKLENGFYDDITNAKTDINYFNRLVAMGGIDGSGSDYGIKYINDSEVNIIFLAKVVTERNAIGTTKSSITQLFGLHVSDAREVFNGVNFNVPVNSASLAIDLISHTYKLSTGTAINYEVEIIKAWLVPSNIIGYGTWNAYYYTMTSKPYWAEHGEKTFKAYFIKPCHVVETYTLQGSAYDINYKYYAGVYGYGLPLKNQINKIIMEVEYIATESDININIMQGDKQQDITSMFEVSLSGQAQSEDNLHKTQRWLHNISDMLGMTKSAVMAGMATKYGLGSIYEGAQYTLGLLDGIKDVRPEGTTNKGAGLSTFAWYLTNVDINNHLLNFPFYYTRFRSIKDEKENALMYGLIYANKIYDEPLGNLFINETPLEATRVDFLQSQSVVSGIPKKPTEFIQNELARGIWLTDIDN